MRPKIPRPKGPGARTLVRAVDGDLRVEPGLVRPDFVVERLRRVRGEGRDVST